MIADRHDVDPVIRLWSLVVTIEPGEGIARRTSSRKNPLDAGDSRASLRQAVRDCRAHRACADDDDLRTTELVRSKHSIGTPYASRITPRYFLPVTSVLTGTTDRAHLSRDNSSGRPVVRPPA